LGIYVATITDCSGLQIPLHFVESLHNPEVTAAYSDGMHHHPAQSYVKK